MNFGMVLKDVRTQLGLSQNELASELGTTQRHVSFLETGRSQPGRAMLGRLVSDLKLSAGQRATLFEASGYRSPYKRRDFDSDEVAEALDVIENRLLAHWPFPGFVMDSEWTMLRMNKPAKVMFQPFRQTNAPLNFLDLMMSDAFRALIQNWEEASTALYFRLQAAAAGSNSVNSRFQAMREAGIFDHVSDAVLSAKDIPIFVPVAVQSPGGPLLNLTSMMGQLVSVNDALVEGFEIELMLPVDAATESCMLDALGGVT